MLGTARCGSTPDGFLCFCESGARADGKACAGDCVCLQIAEELAFRRRQKEGGAEVRAAVHFAPVWVARVRKLHCACVFAQGTWLSYQGCLHHAVALANVDS